MTLEEARAAGIVAPLATAPVVTKAVATVGWLVQLLACNPFRGRTTEEERLQIEVATHLRQLSLAGSLRSVWGHPPLQSDLPFTMTMAPIVQAKKKAMGAIPGTPDLMFYPGGFIELKVKRRQTAMRVHDGELKEKPPSQLQGQLSQEQRWYRDWCGQFGVPYEVASSVPDVLLILQRWKVLD